MRLKIRADLLEGPFITESFFHVTGVVDLSNIEDYVGGGEEEYFLEVGMYPWYSYCGRILSIEEII